MRPAKFWMRLVGHGSLLILLVVAGAAAPATALDNSDNGSDQFCSTLETRGERLDAKIDELQSTVHAAWQQQSARLRVMITEQQTSSEDLVGAIDIQRAHNLAELRRQAHDGRQRTAVDTYQRTQAHASLLRRKAVRRANDNFTAALKRIVADRQATQAGQVEALRIAIDDDLQTAKGQCAEGTDPQLVMHDFEDSILTTRQTFATQRKNDAVIISQLASLKTTRRQAITLADQQYNAVMTQARHRLQATLRSS